MSDNLKIAIASYSSSCLNSLEAVLQTKNNFTLERILVPESQGEKLRLDKDNCDVLVLGLTDRMEPLLSLAGNIPLVVICPVENAELMRLAFKAGASDVLIDPYSAEELHAAIDIAHQDSHKVAGAEEGDLSVFVSPKGGAGATTLAVHLAHILSTREYLPSVLLADLDLQYGNLPLHFNEKPSSRLAAAMARGDRIDATILDACISRVTPKLHTLATHSEQLRSPWDFETGAVSALIKLARQRYDHVLIDIPRSINPVTFGAMENATRICIVLQQTLADLHMAHQYLRLLQDQGISSDTFSVVVNRYEKSNAIRLQDFENAFDGHAVHGVPNDYKRVSFSAENTVPLVRKWRNSVITKNLVQFSEQCWPDHTKTKRWSFSYSSEAGKAA